MYPENPILIVDDEEHFLDIIRIALQMAGGVAHDFNNILAVVNGYTDMLIG